MRSARGREPLFNLVVGLWSKKVDCSSSFLLDCEVKANNEPSEGAWCAPGEEARNVAVDGGLLDSVTWCAGGDFSWETFWGWKRLKTELWLSQECRQVWRARDRSDGFGIFHHRDTCFHQWTFEAKVTTSIIRLYIVIANNCVQIMSIIAQTSHIPRTIASSAIIETRGIHPFQHRN